MYSRLQSARGGIGISRCSRLALWAFLLAVLFLSPCLLGDQQPPPGAIGRIEGRDVSVEGGASTGNLSAASAQGIFVSNGSVVTVHSGQALLTLTAGGQIDICGPAKLTLLQSAGAITVALNFGRLRVQLPASTQLRIFTPTIVATPLDISGGSRDINVGLELNDSLCVLASSGALRLEQQFTGEGLIIPQSGEFFLAAGRLVPVAGIPGSCHCEAIDVHAIPARPPSPPVPEMGVIARSQIAPPPQPKPQPDPAPAAKPAAPASPPAPEPIVTLGVLAKAGEIHPNTPTPKEKDAPLPPPPVSMPEYKIDLPPLTFSVTAPAPPSDPAPDTILLIRIAHLEPEWQFTGRVESPRFEQVAQRTSAPPTPAEAAHPKKQSPKKKGGFWAALRHIFVGNEIQN